MKKSELKAVVKECLVELLAEGLATAPSRRKKVKQKKERVRLEEKRLAAHRAKFDTRVDDTITSITPDPILQGVLRDTANTTLQEQLTNDPSRAGAPMLNESSGAGIDISNIFSNATDKWEALAFENKKN
jgi:hypothetical protein